MPRGKKNKKSSSCGGPCFLCGRTSPSRCDKCRLVYYCSREHFVLHHQRDYCFPYKLEWRPPALGGGHVVVATREIKPLELVLFEWNLVVGPGRNAVNQSHSCVECFEATEAECGKCGAALCESHQGESAATVATTLHARAECQGRAHHVRFLNPIPEQVLSRGKEENLSCSDLSSLVMPLRITLGRKSNTKVQSRTQFILDNYASTLEASMGTDTDWVKTREALLKFIMKSCMKADEKPFVTEDELRFCFNMSRCHSLPLNATSQIGGVILYSTFSLFGHSCRSNAKFVSYPNRTVAVMAQTGISQGGEIKMSLVSKLEPTWKRRARLYRDHLVLCRCPRCRDPTELGTFISALKCPKSDIDDPKCGILPVDATDPKSVWRCERHKEDKKELSAEEAQKVAINLHRELYSRGMVTTVEKLEIAVGEFSSQLHPHHGLALSLKRALLNLYSQRPAGSVGRKEYLRVRDLAHEQLAVLSKVDPGFPDWRGEVTQHYSAGELNLARMDFESGSCTRAEFLLRVRKATVLAQEGMRGTQVVRVDRSLQYPIEMMVEEMSADSSYMSDASCCSAIEGLEL